MGAPITYTTHALFCTIAILAGVLLIFLIIKKSPHTMRAYSIIILDLAIIELSAAGASLSICLRIMSTKDYLLSAITGLCKSSQSARLCFSIYAFMMHCNAQQMVLVAFCFCYRCYAIRTVTHSLTIKMLLLLLFIAHLPTSIPLGYYGSTELFNSSTTREIFGAAHPGVYQGGMLIIGSRMDYTSVVVGTSVTLYMMIPTTLVIGVATVLTVLKLSSSLLMSEANKRLHKGIMKGLCIQATLPLLHLIAVLAYKLRQFGVVSDSEELGYLPVTVGAISVAVSPIITIVSVRPYRRILKTLGIGNPQIHPTTDSFTI